MILSCKDGNVDNKSGILALGYRASRYQITKYVDLSEDFVEQSSNIPWFRNNIPHSMAPKWLYPPLDKTPHPERSHHTGVS